MYQSQFQRREGKRKVSFIYWSYMWTWQQLGYDALSLWWIVPFSKFSRREKFSEICGASQNRHWSEADVNTFLSMLPWANAVWKHCWECWRRTAIIIPLIKEIKWNVKENPIKHQFFLSFLIRISGVSLLWTFSLSFPAI